MSIKSTSGAHAAANLAEGSIFGSVEIAAPPERVFRALTTKEVIDWWIRPGVFHTTGWTGDVRFDAAGLAAGPNALRGSGPNR